MKKTYLTIIVGTIIVALLLLNFGFLGKPQIKESIDVFFGIDVAYPDQVAIRGLIDKVSSYTNIFVIGSTGISHNETKLDETCQYLYDKGLSFIIYTEKGFQREWSEAAKIKWSNHFLGFYFMDETGGKQLDRSHYAVREAENYVDAGNQFVNIWSGYLESMNYFDSTNSSVFTSDYTLYWFDYKAGYDVVFAELGWNYSRQLNVAFCRGAATMQNKEWGVMITWTYNHPPYIESGSELYEDLVYAYKNGAKYVIVFDSNKEYTEGVLKQEHFEALQQFWEYTRANPRKINQSGDRVVYVLPKDFAYGFRGPDDKIWGLWEANDFSFEISTDLGGLLEEYGNNLDIVYNDGIEIDKTYGKYIFWNGTISVP